MLALLLGLVLLALLLVMVLSPVRIGDETYRKPSSPKPILWGQSEKGEKIEIYPK